ncbi:hypothetical protein GY45DRAFT_817394 [Cubamyces sp. BRFM 1775]|nr:hypothetical protein GY45DRAFT_817394 [Cubamyces sp. BRFM 1775]
MPVLYVSCNSAGTDWHACIWTNVYLDWRPSAWLERQPRGEWVRRARGAGVAGVAAGRVARTSHIRIPTTPPFLRTSRSLARSHARIHIRSCFSRGGLVACLASLGRAARRFMDMVSQYWRRSQPHANSQLRPSLRGGVCTCITCELLAAAEEPSSEYRALADGYCRTRAGCWTVNAAQREEPCEVCWDPRTVIVVDLCWIVCYTLRYT